MATLGNYRKKTNCRNYGMESGRQRDTSGYTTGSYHKRDVTLQKLRDGVREAAP